MSTTVTTGKEVEVLTAPETGKELKTVDESGNIPLFEVVKAVTRPVLRFGVRPEFIRVESAMREGELMEKAKIKNPPTLMDIIDLRTGEAMVVVCATVFANELENVYPADGYVGKDFQVRKINVDGKDYSLWSITEIKLK